MNPSPAVWPLQRSPTPNGWSWPAANRSVIAGDQWPVTQRLYQVAGTNPSLDLNFARTKTLNDSVTGRNLITYTRNSTARYVSSTGTIQTAVVNEPRFDHNPTTGESLGLLVEEARTNLVLQSEDFSNAYWVKTSCTITSNESTAPNGTLTADLWTNTGSPGVIENSITKDTTARTYTSSLWVKGTLSQLTVSLDDGTTVNRGRVQYNLSTEVVGTVFNDGLFTNTSGRLTRFPDGWVRVTMTTTTSIGTTIRLRPFFSGIGSIARIWGAQVEEGAFATSYIPTTTATATRAADVASITGSNFSSWYNQNSGTVYAEYRIPALALGTISSFDDGTANNRWQQRYTATALRHRFVATGSIVDDTDTALVPSISILNKAAYATTVADQRYAGNGILNNTARTQPAMPVVTQLQLGVGVASDTSGQIRISRLTYWPTRLSNTVLQQITQP